MKAKLIGIGAAGNKAAINTAGYAFLRKRKWKQRY